MVFEYCVIKYLLLTWNDSSGSKTSKLLNLSYEIRKCNDDDYDSDDPEYNAKVNEYHRYSLQPGFQPIMIYKYTTGFMKQDYADKYMRIIESEMCNLSLCMDDLVEVHKIERRRRIT